MGLSSEGCSVALIGLREKLFSQEDNNYFFALRSPVVFTGFLSTPPLPPQISTSKKKERKKEGVEGGEIQIASFC